MPPPAEGLASRLVLGPALRTQPDRRLVALVRQGYETAFEEIVRRYAKPLGRYAAAIVGPRSEDVTQDAFSKALLALRRNDAEIELRPWLFRIVRNTALNDLRDSPPSPEVLAEALAGGADPADELERREELADLMRRLQALPSEQRAAIVMRELEGLGHEEIAAALGLSGGAARQAIYRARRALRDGVGMLLPLPVLRLLLTADGQATAEVAGGAAGIAGAGMAVKATAATVLVAGTVGAGVALQEGRDARSPEESARAAQLAPPAPNPTPPSTALVTPLERSSSGPGSGTGDDNSGEGGGSSAENHGSGSDDRGKRGGEERDDRSGHSGRGEENDGEDDSGGDSGSSGTSGSSDAAESLSSGSSGSGSSDDDDVEDGSDDD